MPITFPPRTEEEVSRILQPGIVEFEVIKAEEKTSKTGNLMLELTIKCFDQKGKSNLVSDYILTDTNWEWKLRHFCFSCGLDQLYESGKLADVDCFGKRGKAHIKIKHDASGQYKDKNVIDDYIPLGKGEKADFVESDLSDIPF